jgi:hypothetical protein
MTKTLAERVVALGVGKRHSFNEDVWYEMPAYSDSDDHPIYPDEVFTSDPRVAMALMEKLGRYRLTLPGLGYASNSGGFYRVWLRDAEYGEKFETIGTFDDKSLPRAIILACVEALENE